MTHKILIVDDDPNLTDLIGYNLEEEGYSVVVGRDGREGLRSFYTHQPQLVVLDVAMPNLNGVQVCERIREMADTPIIMLTAKGREQDIITGLDSGADDYLTKPFRVGELMARVRANLRRVDIIPSQPNLTFYQDSYLTVDLEAHRVLVDQAPVSLTPTEFKLLAYLIRHRGKVLSFRQILEAVWGFEYIDELHYVRVYIRQLRQKLEPEPSRPIYFLNVLNTGYRFDPQA